MYDLLAGSWHLRYSNFPMWHKDDVNSITFNYTPAERNGKAILKDEIRYLKNGRSKVIKGFDTPDEADRSVFRWRGTGLLWIYVSKWRVEWMNESKDCLIISFEKTFATPAGIDILIKGSDVSASKIEEALSLVKAKGLLNDSKNPFLPVA